MKSPFNVIDLFAGAGGLSLGFSQTKKCKIIAAFEKNENAQETYKKNNPETKLFSDVRDLTPALIEKKFPNTTVDIIIGGPPCQGFSNANRQHNTAINQNNLLVKEYIRSIIELSPKAFVMENVGMLKSDVHKFYKTKNDSEIISKYNIDTKPDNIFLLAEKYKFKGIENIITNLNVIDKYLWPDEQYHVLNVLFKERNNVEKAKKAALKYLLNLKKFTESHQFLEDNAICKINLDCINAANSYISTEIDLETFIKKIERPLKIQQMLKTSKEILDNNIEVTEYNIEHDILVKTISFPVFEYLTKILGSEINGYNIKSGILTASDYGVPQIRRRFVVMGIKKTISNDISLPPKAFDHFYTVHDAISDIENVQTTTEVSECGVTLEKVSKKELNPLAAKLRNSKKLYNHIITATRPNAQERFNRIKQGENFHSLSDEYKTNTYTNVERTQNTVYLRLKYSEPSGTVINVRKSMWIHPTLNRAVSVREAARLQSFPDSFIFCGTKDSQYQQVGNAVPPMMAEAIARQLLKYLDISFNKSETSVAPQQYPR